MDSIGISTAGVVSHNQLLEPTLFRSVPQEDKDRYVRSIFMDIAKKNFRMFLSLYIMMEIYLPLEEVLFLRKTILSVLLLEQGLLADTAAILPSMDGLMNGVRFR